jgi:hypothetical protein
MILKSWPLYPQQQGLEVEEEVPTRKESGDSRVCLLKSGKKNGSSKTQGQWTS